MADAQAQLRQHAEAMIRCVRQASAARAAEPPESVEAAAAAARAALVAADLAAAEARAEAEASRRVRAESEAAERLRSQTAAEAALAEAKAALAHEVEAKLALQAEIGELMRALRSAEEKREELQARLQTSAARQQPQQMEGADAAATAEVPAQVSDIETEGAQPEVGAAGEPAAAANAAKGAGSSLGSGKPRKVPGSNERKPTGDARVPAPVPAPVVPPLGPAAPAALPGEGAAAHARSAWNYVPKHNFEESMESIDTTADGSCGFWCWLAFFSSCNHAVVRTREQLRQIKQKQIEAGDEMMLAMSRTGRSSRSRAQPRCRVAEVCCFE